MLTKGAIGNLINRYRAVLKKCNLINTFGSLAVASMLVLGGAGVASAADGSIHNESVDSYTGSEITANASSVVNESGNIGYGLQVSTGEHTLGAGNKLTITNNMTGNVRNYGLVVKNDAKLTVNREIEINVSQAGADQVRGIRNNNNGGTLIFNENVTVNTSTDQLNSYDKDYMTGIDTWNGTTTFNKNVKVESKATNTTNGAWVNALQLDEGGTVNFLGEKTELLVSNAGYTAQTVNTTNVNDEVNFNSALTTIIAKSDFGVNGIAGSGIAKFAGNDAVVNINVLVDTNGDGIGDAGSSNAIGIMSNVEVADTVKEFNVTVAGSGIDHINPRASNGTAAIFAVGDTVNINAQKFTATVDAAADRATGDNTYGIRSSVGGNVTITSDIINIDVTDNKGSAYGVRANCNDLTDGSSTYKDAGSITLGGDNSEITINAAAENGYAVGIAAHRSNNVNENNASSVVVNGKSLTVNAEGETAYGVLVMNNTTGDANTVSTVTINSADTTINAENGIVALSQGTINANGNLTVNSEGGNAITARGSSTVNINTEGKDRVVKLIGDIAYDYNEATSRSAIDAKVNLNLTNDQSFFTGKIVKTGDVSPIPAGKDGVSGMALGLSNGGTWNATGDSFVNSLKLDDGVVNITGEHEVTVDNEASGTGTVQLLTNAPGTFIVKDGADKLTALSVTTEKNADEISTSDLAALTDNIEGVAESKLTATAAAGIVNDAVSVDTEGNIVSGGGVSSVTEAVLESASVNTVALDKILTNDVRKRLGDIRSDKNQTGVWMRWDGGKLKGDSGLTNDFNTIQIGGDTKVGKNCRLGVAGSFTHGDGEFDRGHSELEGFSFAAYATWMGENGMFADVVARLGHFSTEMNVEGRTGDMDNRVFSLSGEYGWRFNVCEQFFVEPQVELAYTYVNSEDLQLGDARFAFDSVDSLTGRAGLVFGWNLPDDRGNVYARASVLQQFMGDAKVTGYTAIGPTVHELDGDDTWLEYGIGANIKLTDKTYIWADVERTEGADVEEEWRGTVGIRYSF